MIKERQSIVLCSPVNFVSPSKHRVHHIKSKITAADSLKEANKLVEIYYPLR